MCLLVPGKIVKIVGDEAVVSYGFEERNAKILDDGFVVGDYALVQGGFLVQKVLREEAEESLRLYKEALDS